MKSRRCRRCWKSFEHSRLAREHEDTVDCGQKSLPDFERLMSIDDEQVIVLPTDHGSEEDAWWAIFQRLIPGMAERSIDLLKLQYSPCECVMKLLPLASC